MVARSSQLSRALSRHLTTAAGPVPTPELCGSAPALARHLILNTPHSRTTWPSHLESVSPLYRKLATRWGKPVGLDLGFAFTDAGLADATTEWDPQQSRFESPDAGSETE